MNKWFRYFLGVLALVFGSVALLVWWEVFILALKGVAGVAGIIVGALIIYFTRYKDAKEKFIYRITHKD